MSKVNGVLVVNKPAGISSFGVVAEVRKKYGVKKVGHAGTLDPMATGVLVVCIGEATKIASYLMSSEKEYEVLMKLGEETTTEDRTGEIIKEKTTSHLKKEEVQKVILSFIGEIDQTPPIYSALKFKGKPLYKYAREGKEVPIKSRKITVHNIEVLEKNLPYVRLKVSCSKGTYIRSLCRDMGSKLDVGAHMSELVRTKSGQFSLKDEGKFYSLAEALSHMPTGVVSHETVPKIKNGIQPKLSDVRISEVRDIVKLMDENGDVLAMASPHPQKPVFELLRVFNN